VCLGVGAAVRSSAPASSERFVAAKSASRSGAGTPTPKPGATQCTPGGRQTACAPLAALLPAAGCAANGSDCALVSEVRGSGGALLARNVQLLGVPGALALAAGVRVDVELAPVPAADGSTPVTLTARGGAAFYATLFTLADGRFSDNAVLLMPEQPLVVSFLPFRSGQGEALAQSLRVEHLGLYVVPS
jgi:hypothetical protein